MPSNTNILMIRHAEKPDTGTGLSVSGQARAQAYAVYFQNYSLQAGPPGVINLQFLFAAADSSESDRPRLTLQPLADAVSIEINAKHSDKDYGKVVEDLQQHSKYNNSHVLICWHHGEILNFAQALGVNPAELPPSAHWPADGWPDDVFGWLLQLCYDSQGNIIVGQTLCLNERLMYDDYVNNPPTVNIGRPTG